MSRKIDPKIAETKMISAGLQPLEPFTSAISDWKCRCLACKKIVTSRYNRVQQGSGCPLCGAKAGGMKIRLSEKNAINRLKQYNLEPLEPYKKSDVKWKCKCMKCGEIEDFKENKKDSIYDKDPNYISYIETELNDSASFFDWKR